MKKQFLRIVILCYILLSTNIIIAQTELVEVYVNSGKMDLELTNYSINKSKLDSIIVANNATIESENEGNFYSRITNTMLIKIPKDKFNDVVNSISTIASRIIKKDINRINVEKEKANIQNQINAKEEIRTRFVELVETAEINTEIETGKEEIEKINNEIAILKNSIRNLEETEFSFLALEISSNTQIENVTDNGGNQVEFSQNGIKQILMNILIYSLPVAILALIYILLDRYKKRQRRKKSKSSSKSPW